MTTNTFEGLLALLVKNNVRFMLVGGLACSLNGFVRTTEDMDILVDDAPSNLANLLASLVHFGQGYSAELNIEDFADEEGAIRIQEDFDLDIFVRMSGKKYTDFLGNLREHHMADGALIPYLDTEGLILLKQGSVREKDRIDVVALLELRNKPKQENNSLSINDLREPLE